MSHQIKFTILKHLSENPDTWSSTVSKVCAEINMGQLFVEKAMKDLVDRGELKRCSDGTVPTYQAPGASEGKYAGFNDKRLEGMENPTTSGGFEPDPRKESLTPYRSV